MSAFSAAEIEYLHAETDGPRLARLATVGKEGTPHVVPVGWSVDEQLEVVEIRGYTMVGSKKYRDVQHSGRAAIVIDEVLSTDPWTVRGIEIRGRADAVEAPEALIRVHPDRVVSWGLD